MTNRNRAYYADSIADFLIRSSDEILGTLVRSSAFSIEGPQRNAWLEQISLLKGTLETFVGRGK